VHVLELWRYPAKSMAGEMLPEVEVGEMGVAGDRSLYVVDDQGVVLTARTRPGLLLHRGGVDDRGRPTVDGLHWEDAEVARRVAEAGRPSEGARLMRAAAGERFDILPLLVATDGAIAATGVDRRRFRPNLVIGGVEGLAERGWEGKFLRIGEAVIGLASLRQRCVMTTWDPDTIKQDKRVLVDIYARFEGTLALNAWAVIPGRVKVGDTVELVEKFETDGPPVTGRYVTGG